MIKLKIPQVDFLNREILVFSSNINNEEIASKICAQLLKMEGIRDATIDLEDRENILRVEVLSGFSKCKIENEIFKCGFRSAELY